MIQRSNSLKYEPCGWHPYLPVSLAHCLARRVAGRSGPSPPGVREVGLRACRAEGCAGSTQQATKRSSEQRRLAALLRRVRVLVFRFLIVLARRAAGCSGPLGVEEGGLSV